MDSSFHASKVTAELDGNCWMDRTFYSLFIAVQPFLFRGDAATPDDDWNQDQNGEDSEATVECAIHFVMAQQIHPTRQSPCMPGP